ncbi:MAG: hypothetical protein JSY10_13195 [Paenibacillus sp.]|nr:hypothetical protein [Paenibacillus sp.]
MIKKPRNNKSIKIILGIVLALVLVVAVVYAYYFSGSYSGADEVNAQIEKSNMDKEEIQALVTQDEQQLDAMNFKFYIDNKSYSIQDLRDWQKDEFIKTNKLLNRRFKQNIKIDDKKMSFETIKGIVVAQKVAIGQDNLKKGLARQTEFGGIASKVANAVSFGKRKVSVADIYLENSKYDAQEVMRQFEQMMTVNNTQNQLMNLKANPNHFYSSGSETTQEVVEMTGGTRFTNRFFLKYGDDSGLSTKKDPEFVVETAGTGYLEDGTAIGGVRHAMTDEGDTLHVRLQVEFPASMPNRMLHQHAIHLLVEFSNWLSDIENGK